MFSMVDCVRREIAYDVLTIMTRGWEKELDWMRNSDLFTLDDIARSLTTHKKAIKAMQKYELETFGKVIHEY